MSTQIYIQPPVTAAGCQPEYTKIASQSFIFEPYLFPVKPLVFTGGNVSILDYVYPIWSADVRNYGLSYTAGNINNSIDASIAAMGIPIPINLVSNDTATISGNASFNNASTYIEVGWEVSLIVGVYYFNCSEVVGLGARVFTFIPVSTTQFDKDGKACFNADVTLGNNFDVRDTRILVGYNIIATCPTEDCDTPSVDANVATVSYTLDIERPCQVDVTNYIIKNCCEGSITELVNIPGLVVGNFHVDDEGNCWEVMSESTDITNFTRTFTDIYTTCLECQDANPCPLNLAISSCCVEGTEFVTGSLPGLNVGDTFVDNYGLCWTVYSETGAPISEESITVVSIIGGTCVACTTANPCPNFYVVQSCCAKLSGIIAVPDVLNVGDSFVDAQGQCWQVREIASQLPTIYGVEVVTVYPASVDPCGDCIAANPCPTEYFITIKSCCDQDRVEIAQVPAEFMFFTEGAVFNDYWGLCWEVTSFNTTGTATYEIWPFVGGPKPEFSNYEQCEMCVKNWGCLGIYNIKDCQTDIVYNNVRLNVGPTGISIGSFYSGGLSGNSIPKFSSCFEVLSFGYLTYPPIDVIDGGFNYGPSATCEECQLTLNTTKTLEFSQCCPGAPNIIVEYTGIWTTGFGGIAMVPLSMIPGGPYTPTCVTLVGFSTATPIIYNQIGVTNYTGDCVICTDKYACS